MSGAKFDVVGLGNAIVDVLARADDAFLAEHGIAKDAMNLIDEPRAELLTEHAKNPIITSGGSGANTIAGLASFGASAGYIGKIADDELGHQFMREMMAAGVPFHTRPLTDGPATARSIIFANGFDRVLVFAPGQVPLFKAFVSGDSVVALKFVLYGAEAFLAEKPVGFGSCVLGAPASTAIKAFGEPEISQHEQAMSSLDKLHYFDRGLTITAEKGKIVVFDVYAPPNAATKRTVLDLLGNPRRTI